MPTRDHTPTGAPCWIDLATTDVERARSFYPAVLGWSAWEASEEFRGYFMFAAGAEPVGGCMPVPGLPADAWTVYLSVADAAATVAAVEAGGGQVVVPLMAVADLGTTAVVVDPGGAAVGLWQPGTFAGLTRLGEPGTPGWFELRTAAFDISLDFYRSAFGCSTKPMSETPDFRYTLIADGDEPLGGVLDGDADVPAAWSVYFCVEDTDAAALAVETHGGLVLEAPRDSPWGRVATVADPGGASFKIIAPPQG